jgi:hypothetical protein|tara:strand:+ start:5510 stop:6421 length:912 start_codon:yes stop_codon:yes gene_type:complete
LDNPNISRWNFFRDPLLHFLVAGLALFVLYDLLSPTTEEPTYSKVINVDEQSLLSFIQYRTKIFDPSIARSKLKDISASELDGLIADYVREEALHRQALAMGLGENDYVIRRRLVQKVEFVARSLGEGIEEPDREDVEDYFQANQNDYVIGPTLTFTHVFFSADERGMDEAKALAGEKLVELNSEGVTFSEAPQHGDLFAYHVNYVDRSPSLIASHFGWPMTKDILSSAPTDQAWRGPFTSDLGSHLVLLKRNEPEHIPSIDEVFDRIILDLKRSNIRQAEQAAIADIVAGYEVQINYQPTIQ